MLVQCVLEVLLTKQGGSLTGAALGGTTFPELVTVHPAGKPGYVVAVAVELVSRVVGVHPPAFGCCTEDCFALWVPWNGIGLFVSPVADGATAACTAPPLPFELTVPPTAVIDCQVPSVPVYLYWLPVE